MIIFLFFFVIKMEIYNYTFEQSGLMSLFRIRGVVDFCFFDFRFYLVVVSLGARLVDETYQFLMFGRVKQDLGLYFVRIVFLSFIFYVFSLFLVKMGEVCMNLCSELADYNNFVQRIIFFVLFIDGVFWLYGIQYRFRFFG